MTQGRLKPMSKAQSRCHHQYVWPVAVSWEYVKLTMCSQAGLLVLQKSVAREVVASGVLCQIYVRGFIESEI